MPFQLGSLLLKFIKNQVECYIFQYYGVDMQTNKISSSIWKYVKSAIAAAALPVFLIYIMIGKPDYAIMNGLAHVVLPVADVIGDVVTWPIRVVGNVAGNIRELSSIRSENEELRAKLDELTRRQTEFDIAISENQRLRAQIDIAQSVPQSTIIADVSFDMSAFHHNTFFISKGRNSGVAPNMAVVSFDRTLVGVIIDVGANFARVRALNDAKSNIPVRIAGTGVYGFLVGRGAGTARLDFISDPEFQTTPGLKLVTSNIRGVLPDGIVVGELTDDNDVHITSPATTTRVMVLGFDNKDRYK